MQNKRRAILLLITLVTLALSAALALPLLTFSGRSAVRVHDESFDVQHALIVESMVALLPELLGADRRIEEVLDRVNLAIREYVIGDIAVRLEIQDDSAKLPPMMVQTSVGQPAQPHPLAIVTSLAHLPPLEPRDRAVAHAPTCLDDLFAAPTDTALFGDEMQRDSWCRYVTAIPGTISARRADAAVLEAVFADLAPGLGTRIHGAVRASSSDNSIRSVLEQLELPPAAAQRAQSLLGNESRTYSLLIRSASSSETRRSYVLCSRSNPPLVLANWEVAP